jgi:hypothetical protein
MSWLNALVERSAVVTSLVVCAETATAVGRHKLESVRTKKEKRRDMGRRGSIQRGGKGEPKKKHLNFRMRLVKTPESSDAKEEEAIVA